MPSPNTPPIRANVRHLYQRAGRFYARVRVPPSLGHSSTHLQKTLRTSNYAEALRRLPVVVGELMQELHRLRAAAEGRATGAMPRTVEAEAAWWRARAEKAGAAPGRLPDAFEDEWEQAIGSRLGEVIGEGRDGAGRAFPIHQGEAKAQRLADLVFERILPVEAELDRFIGERGFTTRYANRHRRVARRLREWLLKRHGTDDLRRVDRREAGHFVDHLLSDGLSTTTANSLTGSLGVYWKWMGARVGLEGNPWADQQRRAKPGEPLAKVRPFTEDEVRRLLSGDTSSTLHDMMRIAALTGMRIGEIARLAVVDTAGGVFRIEEGKTAASTRDIPIHPSLTKLVARRCAGKAGEARLFSELRESPSRKKELSAKASERFTTYRRSLGIDERVEGQRRSDITFHSFRHWFVSAAIGAGQEPHLVSAVVGHAEGRKGMTLGTYWGGPTPAQARAVVKSVQLPVRTPVESPPGPLLGAGRRRGRNKDRARS